MELTYELTSRSDAEERNAIFNPLIDFNKSQAGDPEYIPLNVLVHEGNEVTVGGLWGHTAYGWFVTELLFLPERLRGRGIASSILHEAETESIRRGCQNSWVDTHESQRTSLPMTAMCTQ